MNSFKQFILKFDSRIVAIGGLLMAVASWFFDAAIDVTFFETDDTYWQSVLQPTGHEIWMRIFVSSMLIGLGLLTAFLLNLHEEAEQQQAYSKAQLEKLAIDLEAKNTKLQREIDLRKQVEQRLAALATTDALTGIANRRKFDEMLEDELKREERYPRGLSLIIIDIDFFKQVNDNLGHDVGDKVLVGLAKLIRTNAREADSFFRIGGEEFALLTFDTSVDKLHGAAERLRKIVEAHNFGIERPVTISLGASQYKTGDDYTHLFKRADDALYEAKRTGRNRAVLR